MTHEERKVKAVELLKELDIYKPYIKGFVERNQVCFFERFGGYWVDQEPEVEKKMKEIEATFDCTIFFLPIVRRENIPFLFLDHAYRPLLSPYSKIKSLIYAETFFCISTVLCI